MFIWLVPNAYICMSEQGMLRNFRVAELQVLLGYANLNQTGRKSDLLTRAMTVIDNNPSPFLQDKIQHLYQLVTNMDQMCVIVSNSTIFAVECWHQKAQCVLNKSFWSFKCENILNFECKLCQSVWAIEILWNRSRCHM